MGTRLHRLLASGQVHFARSPVYSLLFMDLYYSPPGASFDSVDWQWAYKLHKYCTQSLYALIFSSPNYIQYMSDALYNYLNILHVRWRQRRNKTIIIVSLQGFIVVVTHCHLKFLPDVLYVVSLK